MTSPNPAASRFRFAEFEIGGIPLELTRDGSPVPLQPQPGRALWLLVNRAGDVVTREELREHLWGSETYLDYEQGINFTIRKIRAALGDEPSRPRFIETLPRLGYRFVAPVEPLAGPPPSESKILRRRFMGLAAAFAFGALAVVAVASRREPTAAPRPVDVVNGDAYEAYLRGRYLVGRGDRNSVLRGIDELETAVTLAPDLARAQAALAGAHLRLRFTRPSAEVGPPALLAARRALELDPELAEAHLAVATVELYFHLDWPAAGRSFRRALELRPRDARVLHGYGLYLASLGRFDAAIDTIRRAVDLDPAAVFIASDLAHVYFWARRYRGAAEQARQNLSADPEHVPSRAYLIEALAALGDRDGALEENNVLFGVLGHPTATTHHESLLRSLEILEGIDADGRHLDLEISAVLLELGEPERARERLIQACDERSDWLLPFLAVDPRFDRIRAHPDLVPCLAPLEMTFAEASRS